MQKKYTKPMLYCETLEPERMVCACDFRNPELNEEWHCGFEPPGMGFRIFAEDWSDCDNNGVSDTVESYFCYHSGTVNLFGS